MQTENSNQNKIENPQTGYSALMSILAVIGGILISILIRNRKNIIKKI